MSSIKHSMSNGRSKREDFDVPTMISIDRFEASGEKKSRYLTPVRYKRVSEESNNCCDCLSSWLFCCG